MPEINHCCATVISANIAARRRALGMTRQELSATLGYDDSGKYFQRVEKLGQSVPAEYLPTIASALKVNDIREFYVEDRFVRLDLL